MTTTERLADVLVSDDATIGPDLVLAAARWLLASGARCRALDVLHRASLSPLCSNTQRGFWLLRLLRLLVTTGSASCVTLADILTAISSELSQKPHLRTDLLLRDFLSLAFSLTKTALRTSAATRTSGQPADDESTAATRIVRACLSLVPSADADPEHRCWALRCAVDVERLAGHLAAANHLAWEAGKL